VIPCHPVSFRVIFPSSLLVRIAGSLGVVVVASTTHEGEFTVFLGVAHEVGAVVKAGITCAAKAVFVVITFDVALLFGEFEAGNMFYRKRGYASDSSISSSSPVVGSSRGHFRSFVRSLSQLPSGNMVEKYFNFIDLDIGLYG